MAKFYGKIGFCKEVETEPGIWESEISERAYYGDVSRSLTRFQTTDQVNDDINLSIEISIIADPYANMNCQSMKYVEFMGAKWKISDVNVQHPRLILTIGGVYNGK
jgi:hypothetical protein